MYLYINVLICTWSNIQNNLTILDVIHLWIYIYFPLYALDVMYQWITHSSTFDNLLTFSLVSVKACINISEKTKCLNRIAKICKCHICLREENISFIDNYKGSPWFLCTACLVGVFDNPKLLWCLLYFTWLVWCYTI
jgi:hypothetical protein